jgi:hypothetical protein
MQSRKTCGVEPIRPPASRLAGTAPIYFVIRDNETRICAIRCDFSGVRSTKRLLHSASCGHSEPTGNRRRPWTATACCSFRLRSLLRPDGIGTARLDRSQSSAADSRLTADWNFRPSISASLRLPRGKLQQAVAVQGFTRSSHSPSLRAISSYRWLAMVLTHAGVTSLIKRRALHHFQSDPLATSP